MTFFSENNECAMTQHSSVNGDLYYLMYFVFFGGAWDQFVDT